ncbi:hypothetical protein RJ639_037740 [Escallonia herrerae]|uniref:HSF-type DNA-binding domain-containing protein n=1 Tax=Escallonia herrerae TaxID=1293975 RepID=A0AA88WPL1_9ASTE|nr:hypothetical protein RJ639_037740 [Escallonia herrerae]
MALMLDNCEGILLSLDSHKSVPAPFLTKTYQLVDDPSTDHIVSWGEDDTTFVVWRPPEFARDLLPNYFKHNNFSSFVRQLNTYGFRKIVPDRWEFANEYFKKGEKHLLCEIHRRKTSQPQVAINHHHHHSTMLGGGGGGGPGFFPYSTGRASISPPDSDELLQNSHWYDSDSPPPLISSPTALSPLNNTGYAPTNNSSCTVTALSEDNERLRRSNNMLMSELAHMRKLYNDIIYFVQNHVKPVAPSNNYPPPNSLFLSNNPSSAAPNIHVSTTTPIVSQKPGGNQFFGYHQTNPRVQVPQAHSSQSSLTILDEPVSKGATNNACGTTTTTRTKLFGVPLLSKKRLHPEYNVASNMETSKARFVLEKDDLGLNLMPPSQC